MAERASTSTYVAERMARMCAAVLTGVNTRHARPCPLPRLGRRAELVGRGLGLDVTLPPGPACTLTVTDATAGVAQGPVARPRRICRPNLQLMNRLRGYPFPAKAGHLPCPGMPPDPSHDPL